MLCHYLTENKLSCNNPVEVGNEYCIQHSQYCPSCNKDLSISAFGLANYRKSGRNLYCKECNRLRTKTARSGSKLSYRRKVAQIAIQRQLEEDNSETVVTNEPLYEKVSTNNLEQRIAEIEPSSLVKYKKLEGRAKRIATDGLLRHIMACDTHGVRVEIAAIREILNDAEDGRSVFAESHNDPTIGTPQFPFGVSNIYHEPGQGI